MHERIMMNTIDHSHLEILAKAKAVTGANIIGDAHEGWALQIEYGSNKGILIVKRGTTRIFKKFETLALYLQNLGVNKYKVDSTGLGFSDEAAREISVTNQSNLNMRL